MESKEKDIDTHIHKLSIHWSLPICLQQMKLNPTASNSISIFMWVVKTHALGPSSAISRNLKFEMPPGLSLGTLRYRHSAMRCGHPKKSLNCLAKCPTLELLTSYFHITDFSSLLNLLILFYNESIKTKCVIYQWRVIMINKMAIATKLVNSDLQTSYWDRALKQWATL